MRGGMGVVGIALVIATWWSLLRTLVVPRGSSQLILAKNRGLIWGFRWLAHRTSTYAGRDRILIWASPLGIFTSLLLWLLLFFIGYALLMFATGDLGVAASFREAGSSLFTLGYASTDRGNLTALDFVAAATGPITIGLLIGYLPTMYAAYQQREAEVTLMLARAGEPNWGPELLARHAMVGMVPQLYDLWPLWERWAAEVGESHTNFPVLIQMRSARPNRNWLVALLCVMDAAAMHMALNPREVQDRPRLLLRQGILCLQELATVERIAFDDDPSPDEPSAISRDEFAAACASLATANYAMERSPEDAYPHFRGWRANYEAMAYALAERIEAVPAPWSGPRRPPLPVIVPHRPVNRTPDPDAT
ncbi:MAG: hypothetical protein IPO93_02940 [Actinobacteria bacterium]|nr:hypothetical protein [Actinomycetota bacterium]